MPSKTGPYTSNESVVRKQSQPEPRPRDISKDVDANSGENAQGSKPIRKG
jgi:hypothetical protein